MPLLTSRVIGVGFLVGIGYLSSWQLGLGVAALVALLLFFPTLVFALLCTATWFLFLLVLPKLCIPLTELCVGCYYFPFGWPFLHVVGFSAVVTISNPVPLLILALALANVLLYFFPRTVLSLFALFVLWLAVPLFEALKQGLASLIDNPYGEPTRLPPKVVSGGEAVEIASKGKAHYEVRVHT